MSNPQTDSLQYSAHMRTHTRSNSLSQQLFLVPLFRRQLAEQKAGLSQQKDGKAASRVGSGQEVVTRHCERGRLDRRTRTHTHKRNGSRCLFLSWQSGRLFSRLSGTAHLSNGRESGCEVCLVYLLGVFRLAVFFLWEVNYVTLPRGPFSFSAEVLTTQPCTP